MPRDWQYVVEETHRDESPRQFEFHPSVENTLVLGTLTGSVQMKRPKFGWTSAPASYALAHDPILALCWFTTPGALRFVSGSSTGMLSIFEQKDEAPSLTLLDNMMSFSNLTSISLNATNATLLVSGYAADALLYDVATTTVVRRYATIHDDHINISRFAHHCPHLFATSSFDRTVKAWDARVGGSVPIYTCQQSNSGGNIVMSFSPCDTHFLVSAIDNDVRQYDTSDGRLNLSLAIPPTGQTLNYTRAYYSATGGHVLSGSSEESVVRIHCRATGSLLSQTEMYPSRPYASLYIQSLRGHPTCDHRFSTLVSYQEQESLLELVHVTMQPDRTNTPTSSPTEHESCFSRPSPPYWTTWTSSDLASDLANALETLPHERASPSTECLFLLFYRDATFSHLLLEIVLHRVILMARSPRMATLMAETMTNGTGEEVSPSHVRLSLPPGGSTNVTVLKTSLEIMVQYLYHDTLSDLGVDRCRHHPEIRETLVTCLRYFQLHEGLACVEGVLLAHLTLANLGSLWPLALFQDFATLTDACEALAMSYACLFSSQDVTKVVPFKTHTRGDAPRHPHQHQRFPSEPSLPWTLQGSKSVTLTRLTTTSALVLGRFILRHTTRSGLNHEEDALPVLPTAQAQLWHLQWPRQEETQKETALQGPAVHEEETQEKDPQEASNVVLWSRLPIPMLHGRPLTRMHHTATSLGPSWLKSCSFSSSSSSPSLADPPRPFVLLVGGMLHLQESAFLILDTQTMEVVSPVVTGASESLGARMSHTTTTLLVDASPSHITSSSASSSSSSSPFCVSSILFGGYRISDGTLLKDTVLIHWRPDRPTHLELVPLQIHGTVQPVPRCGHTAHVIAHVKPASSRPHYSLLILGGMTERDELVRDDALLMQGLIDVTRHSITWVSLSLHEGPYLNHHTTLTRRRPSKAYGSLLRCQTEEEIHMATDTSWLLDIYGVGPSTELLHTQVIVTATPSLSMTLAFDSYGLSLQSSMERHVVAPIAQSDILDPWTCFLMDASPSSRVVAAETEEQASCLCVVKRDATRTDRRVGRVKSNLGASSLTPPPVLLRRSSLSSELLSLFRHDPSSCSDVTLTCAATTTTTTLFPWTVSTTPSSLLNTSHRKESNGSNVVTFALHWTILTARCAYFQAMRQPPWREGATNRIDWTVHACPIVEAFLLYLYTDRLVVHCQHALALLALANQVNCLPLTSRLEERVGRIIDRENVWSVLTFASDHCCATLKRTCLYYILTSVGSPYTLWQDRRVLDLSPELQAEIQRLCQSATHLTSW